MTKSKYKPAISLTTFNDSAEKAKRAKITAKTTPKSGAHHGKNSMFWSDDRLINFIEDHAKAAQAHSQSAGKGSVDALRRYYAIGTELLEQKELGKFKKPSPPIEEFCNTHLAGIIGDKNPYSMCGLCMTLARPGKGGRPGMWETFMDHVNAMEKHGTPVGPMGINAAMSLARKLMRGEAADATKPKASKSDRLQDAVQRLKGFQTLVREMLPALPSDMRGEFEARLAELAPVSVSTIAAGTTYEVADHQ